MRKGKLERAIRAAAGILALAVGSTAAAAAAQETADVVFRNGSIYTADAKDTVKQAVAIRNGRILYVGTNDGVVGLIGPKTRTIDLNGRMMMPGLIDGHVHPPSGGSQLRTCSLEYRPLTEADFLQRIQACIDADKAADPDRLLLVTGWYRQFMRPKGFDASRDTLDKLKTTRPIYVRNRDGHSNLVNSRALALAKITDTTPNPPGGSIARHKNGRATGILEDNAARLMSPFMPPKKPGDDLADLDVAMKALSAGGVTSLLDAMATADSLAVYRQLQQQGKLSVRTHAAVAANAAGAKDADEVIARVIKARDEFDQPEIKVQPGIRVHTTKLVMDGVIQAPAQTAGLVQPYWINVGDAGHDSWQPGTHSGPVYIEQDLLEKVVAGLAKAGIESHIHAIGDKTVKLSLDAFARARQAGAGNDIRFAIAHAELVEPVDYKRFRDLNVVPVMSYQWTIPAPNSVTGAKNQLGPERFERMEPFDKLYDAGVRVVYGSDWPVDRMNYWLALKAAITRAGDGSYAPDFDGRLNNAGVLTRTAALRSITIDGAWALHMEKETGSIEKGKLADLIVLDRNFLAVPEDQLADNKVHLTMVGGRIVHDDRALEAGQ